MKKLKAEVKMVLNGALNKDSKNTSYICAEGNNLIGASNKEIVFVVFPDEDRADGFYNGTFEKIDEKSIEDFMFPEWEKVINWTEEPSESLVLTNIKDLVWRIFNANKVIDLYYLAKLPKDSETHLFIYNNHISIFYPEFNMFVHLETTNVSPDIGVTSTHKNLNSAFLETIDELDLQLELPLGDGETEDTTEAEEE